MILGIGVDIVRSARLRRWREAAGLCERFFAPRELAYCLERNHGVDESLAARFAAKEAFGKALGTGLSFPLKNVEVISGGDERPRIELSGRAREKFAGAGGGAVHLSLSHEDGCAAALVVI
ncbi:MAG: holo-ACP synthase, partial [Spirochaetales bacterium]|nr:holo-ACP synthase [Spirochaetales bacterium]